MRFWKPVLQLLALSLSSSLCLVAQSDRIAGPVNSSQRVALQGNVHGLAQSRFDIGRADGSMLMYGVTLAFRPSAAQQQALTALLAQQQDRTSPNFHKWLTSAQFADQFGMTQADLSQIEGWLESEGLTVTSVANSRNQISFQGTVAQIEAAFSTEIHDYLVDGEIHFANASNPSVPVAFAAAVLSIGHLHNFQPKPHAIVHTMSSSQADPHFTSALSGDHYVTPGDFATIYQVNALYTGGIDGTGQKIVLTGQSSINLADVANFRSAADLSANVPTLLLVPNTGTSTRCSGDEGESDLDVEWSGGVAKNASITLVYAGLAGGDTCSGNRQFGAFDALQYAIDQNLAPIISNSYGDCESDVGLTEAQTMQGWIQQANTQGQTVMSASGDSGAADCDYQVTSATHGFAVDIPAAIPEVTAMGGTEFDGDAEGVATNGNVPATQYWGGTTLGSDTISSALSYIPEMGWNDTANSDNTGDLMASGGGASTFFAKPAWQTGTGVPNDNKRDVPDLALNASPFHDPYLFCSEDGSNGTIQASCTNGFRISNGDLTSVGGTSAAAPTFAGILALINQSMGSFGLGNINPTLYSLAAGASSPFNDVTVGNNDVPCTNPSPDCPTSTPFQFGFSAGTGYDQVTGLGSVNANALATTWGGSRASSSITVTPSSATIFGGTSVSFAVTVTASTSVVGSVSFSTLNNGANTALGKATLNTPFPTAANGTATFTTNSLPAGTNTVTATYMGDAAHNLAVSSGITVNVTTPFALSTTPPNVSLSVAAGSSVATTLTITPAAGFTGTVTFTNSTAFLPGSCSSGLPAGALCNFSPNSVTLNGSSAATVVMKISTAANMAIPSGAQAMTVTGTSGGAAITTAVNLTVTASSESFTLTSGSGVTFPVPVGATAAVQLTINSANGFIVGTGAGATTALPLTYSCSGIPVTAEISCTLPNGGQPTNATGVTINVVTTPVTTQLAPPGLGRGSRVFYALLLPGLFGIVFAVGSRGRGVRLLSLIVVLGCSTLWLGACGGSSNNNNSLKNPGTPPGAYAVTISATTGGANPISSSLAITLNVTAQ
jgi:subtilase family serine protease